jgi:outer membrane lipoprotein-sorting protein
MRSARRLGSTYFVALALLWAGPVAAKDPTAQEIVRKAWWSPKLDGAEMISTLTIINAKGQRRVRKTAAISKLYDGGQTEKRLIRFLSPADVKGTGLLTYDYEKKDDDIWFFLPSLRKTRRIVSSEKAKNFMGSEFTYADVTPPPVEDFNYKLLRSEKVGAVDCWVVESIPKSAAIAEENGFGRKVSWLGKTDYVPRKAMIYDRKKRLHKTLAVGEVREIDPKKHRFRAMKLTMVNKQNGRSSVMTVDKIKLRSEIPDRYFTTRFLERI